MIRISQLQPIRYPAGEITFPNITTRNVFLDSPDSESIIALLEIAASQEEPIHAVIPYFPAARADKPGNFDIKPISRMLATGNFSQVTILDIHSQQSRDIVEEAFTQQGIPVVFRESLDIIKHFNIIEKNDYTAIIAPDHGAVYRAGIVAQHFNLPLVIAEKQRDQNTGRITQYKFPETRTDLSNVLVLDDICDGGTTFRLLQESLPGKSDLYVSHGVFSKNAQDNLEGYQNVYTTNSLTTCANLSRAHVLNITEILEN